MIECALEKMNLEEIEVIIRKEDKKTEIYQNIVQI
jgi:hypothetical protein